MLLADRLIDFRGKDQKDKSFFIEKQIKHFFKKNLSWKFIWKRFDWKTMAEKVTRIGLEEFDQTLTGSKLVLFLSKAYWY